jgi:hypothetical protein
MGGDAERAGMKQLHTSRKPSSRNNGRDRLRPRGNLIWESGLQGNDEDDLQDLTARWQDGEYMVIQSATSFGKKKTNVETVTTMVDKDGC